MKRETQTGIPDLGRAHSGLHLEADMCGDPKNFISISAATVYGRHSSSAHQELGVWGVEGRQGHGSDASVTYLTDRCVSGRKAVLEESGIWGRWSLTGGSGSGKVEP